MGTPEFEADGGRAMIDQAEGTDVEQEVLAATPMGRLGRAEEIADAVALLASDRATYITGAELLRRRRMDGLVGPRSSAPGRGARPDPPPH